MNFITIYMKLFLISFSLILTQNLFASSKILVISDVDDTIKVAHVRSKTNRISNAFFNYKAFLGMSDLYNDLSKKPDLNIYYVSNAISFLMHSNHAKFLNKFKFPNVKNLRTRENPSDEQFKTKTILNLVKTESPEVLVLIGDNGERDPSIFQGVRKSLENSSINVLTFIHWTYSDGDGDDKKNVERLTPDDVAFTTPIEIAIRLQLEGILSLDSLSDLSNNLIPQILDENKSENSSITFPSWKTCSEFRWEHPDVIGRPDNIEILKDYIIKKCSKSSDYLF